MSGIEERIERLLASEHIDTDELSEVANLLKDAGRFDMLDVLTVRLLQNHGDDDKVLLLRAWYLTNIECRYEEAADILKTTDSTGDVMYAILYATITLKTTFDADMADDIFDNYISYHQDRHSEVALEAARLFISEQYTDLAEKWISRYEGVKDNDYMAVYAEILISKEEYPEAAALYGRIIAADPASHDAWNRMSDILISMKQYEEAVRAAEKSLALKDTRKAHENIRVCTLCLNRQNNKTNIINNQKLNS